MDLPAGWAVVLGDLGGRDHSVVHRGLHLLRRRQRHREPHDQRHSRSRSRRAGASSAPGGCAHDLCKLGDKLDASCNSCVARRSATRIRTAATAATSRTTRPSRYGTRAASPRWRRTAAVDLRAARRPPGSPQKKHGVPLQAGVHYAIRLDVQQPDARTRPSASCGPAPDRRSRRCRSSRCCRAGAAERRGAGLNVTLLRDEDRERRGEARSRQRRRRGLARRPLADAADRTARTADRRRAGRAGRRRVRASRRRRRSSARATARRCSSMARWSRHVSGIGGIAAGWVRIIGGGRGRRDRRRRRNGTSTAAVPVALGAQTLKLIQQTFAASPASRPRCAPRARYRPADHRHARRPLAQGAGDPVADPIRPTAPAAAPWWSTSSDGDDGAGAHRRPGLGAERVRGHPAGREREVLGADHARPGRRRQSEQGLAQAGVRPGRRRQPAGVRQRRDRSADGGVPAFRRGDRLQRRTIRRRTSRSERCRIRRTCSGDCA